MRLRQLARKLEVSPSKILEILSANGHSVENDPNLKLTDEQEALVLDKLQPKIVQEEITSSEAILDTEETVTIEESITSEVEEIQAEEVKEVESEVIIEEKPLPRKIELPETKRKKPAVYTLEKEIEEQGKDLELIKAPKVKLDGLKVLGKIDLPEPKPKAVEKEEESREEKPKTEKRPVRNGRNNGPSHRKSQNRKPRLNPVEYERVKAEKEAKRKKEEKNKALKEKKAKHYQEKIQTKQKSARTSKTKAKSTLQPNVSEKLVQNTKSANRATKQSKKPTGLKRIWAWLNGRYDHY